MELSARDKRILADIECESALDDPKWTRHFERLGRHGTRPPQRWRRLGLAALLAAAWLAAVIAGALFLRPMLWAALAIVVVAHGAWSARRRRVYGYWFRRRRLVSRIPHQRGARGGRGDG